MLLPSLISCYQSEAAGLVEHACRAGAMVRPWCKLCLQRCLCQHRCIHHMFFVDCTTALRITLAVLRLNIQVLG